MFIAVKKSGRYHAKHRNVISRERRSILLLSVEGENKTEKLYFKNYANEHIKVCFVPGNETDPIKMSRHLVDECSELELDAELGDFAFCLIDSDFDERKDEKITEADSIVKRVGAIEAKVIVSNPCFEIWYLCHFVFSTKQFLSNNDVIDSLKKYLPDYSKSNAAVFASIKMVTGKAIDNAKRLEKHCIEVGQRIHKIGFTPSSEIYKIIEAINARQDNTKS